MDPQKAIGGPSAKILGLSDPVGALSLQSWPRPQTELLLSVRQAQASGITNPIWKSPSGTGLQDRQGPGEGRSLQLAGGPEFSCGKAPLSSLPMTSTSLSPSALGRKGSVGRPGQAPKQATDPHLLPRLEFPDASFIFPNLNTRRPRVVHLLPADVCPQLHGACQRRESWPSH